MTKMATMAIGSKNFNKPSSLEPMTMKLAMMHQGEEQYKIYINHDSGMTLTYFVALNRLKIYDSEKIGPQGLVCPHPGAIYIYMYIL